MHGDELKGEICEVHRPGYEMMVGIIFRVLPNNKVHLHMFGHSDHATSQAIPFIRSEKEIPADGVFCAPRGFRSKAEKKEEKEAERKPAK